MIFRRLAVYTWAVKRSRWARLALENKTGSPNLSLKQPHFPLPCIPPEIRLVYLWRVDGCFYLAKIISFVPFLSVTLFKVINTPWQKLFLREVFQPSWGSAELYIFKNSLSPNSAVSADSCELYVFLCPGRVARKLPSQYATFHVLGTLSILLHFDMLLNIRPN